LGQPEREEDGIPWLLRDPTLNPFAQCLTQIYLPDALGWLGERRVSEVLDLLKRKTFAVNGRGTGRPSACPSGTLRVLLADGIRRDPYHLAWRVL
jgi:hypothetical protein